MAIQNTFTNDNVMVDKMLGRSYDVVKEVYNNLDAIKGLNEKDFYNAACFGYDGSCSWMQCQPGGTAESE